MLFDKFEGDLKTKDIFSHKFFFVVGNFAFKKFKAAAGFKYDNNVLKLQPNTTQIRPFGPKFKDFYFFTKLCVLTNLRVFISNMTIVFSNCSPNTHK